MRAVLFAGQGSQFRGMGGQLLREFKEKTQEASDILGFSVERLCQEGSDEALAKTDVTQPLIYVVNTLAHEKAEREATGATFAAGHSLGEYNALLAAGVFDFATGLRLVQHRGAAMAKARAGGMAALLNLSLADVRRFLDDHQFVALEIANINTPSQIVVSGPLSEIERLRTICRGASQPVCHPLAVGAAFHSSYMRDAQAEYAAFVRQCSFNAPRFTVIANATCEAYTKENAANRLIEQLTMPVRWVDSIRMMLDSGVEEFVEYSPHSFVSNRKILGRMVEEIRADWTQAGGKAAARPAAPPPVTQEPEPIRTTPEPWLGSRVFLDRHRVRQAYVAGSMYRGVASAALVIRMGKAGLLSFFGAGGLSLAEVETAIDEIQQALPPDAPYGINFMASQGDPRGERAFVDLLLQKKVRTVEAAAFTQVTPALALYHAAGLGRGPDGAIHCRHRVLAKVSRPEVACAFMSPAPDRFIDALVSDGAITPEQGALARITPISHDICVEADSGGHTDGGAACVVFPALLDLRDQIIAERAYRDPICMGLAGGLGEPRAVAAAFVLGADFVLTGSINQCTVEAGTRDRAKDMLQGMDVQDTDYAPSGEFFESGSRVQVLKKGVLFTPRAHKLHNLYMQNNAIDDIPRDVLQKIESRYFGQPLDAVWETTKQYLDSRGRSAEIAAAEANPKRKMGYVFRWYFARSTQLALAGAPEETSNYQIQTGPALGAFNRWVRATGRESWRNRHVDDIAEAIMDAAAAHLGRSAIRRAAAARPLAPGHEPAPAPLASARPADSTRTLEPAGLVA